MLRESGASGRSEWLRSQVALAWVADKPSFLASLVADKPSCLSSIESGCEAIEERGCEATSSASGCVGGTFARVSMIVFMQSAVLSCERTVGSSLGKMRWVNLTCKKRAQWCNIARAFY